jgi:hypothetical protein
MGYDWCCDEERAPAPEVERSVFAGDSLIFQVQVYQPPPASAAPQNLTGWSLQFTAKMQYADTDSLAVAISKTTGVSPNVITFPNGAATGLIQVAVGPLAFQTLGSARVRLVYDIKTIDPSGNVTTIERGRLVVWPAATDTTVPD